MEIMYLYFAMLIIVLFLDRSINLLSVSWGVMLSWNPQSVYLSKNLSSHNGMDSEMGGDSTFLFLLLCID